MRVLRNNCGVFLTGFLMFLAFHQFYMVENDFEEHFDTVDTQPEEQHHQKKDKVWLINEPDACKEAPEMLLGVAAAVYAFERREIIRQTWGTYAESENVKLLFFVGDNQDPNTQEKLEVEAEENHDIIQENYIESYWNLTRKTIGQIKWKKDFCNEAKYIAHLDDDVFVDVPNVLAQLRADTRPSWVSCMVQMGKAPVRRTGKYAVTEEEFPGKNYPAACQGPCYFINDKANNQLVEESYKHPEFKLEDMFVTGVLRDEQSVPIWQLTDGSILCQHLGKASLKNTNIKFKEKTVEERLMKAWKVWGPGGPRSM